MKKWYDSLLLCISCFVFAIATGSDHQFKVTNEDHRTFAEELSHTLFQQRQQYDESSTKFQNRKLLSAKYQCNEVIATIPPSEVKNIVNVFALNISPTSAAFVNSVFANILQYGVQIKVVCDKCTSVNLVVNKQFGSSLQSNNNYDSYCGEDAYGYDMEHSGVVMTPLVEDDNGDVVLLNGTLSAFIHTRPTKINRYDIPSQMWSTSGDHVSVEMFVCFLATATKGTVSFAPDFMGYGFSQAYRGFLLHDAYVSSFLPLWVSVSEDLRKESNCKTALGDAAFIEGYSEGGRAGGTPLNIEATILAQTKNFQAKLLDEYWDLATILGASYSNTNPEAANYGTGEYFLNSKYIDPSNPELNVLQWLEEEDIDGPIINQRLLDIAAELNLDENGKFLFEICNSEIVGLFQAALDAGVVNPCSPTFSGYKEDVHGKFCEAILENSLTDSLLKVNYPVHMCHSTSDEVVTFNNIPDITQNPDHISIKKVTGNHVAAGASCITDDVFYFVTNEFLSYNPPLKHKVDGCNTSDNTCSDSTLRFKVKKNNGKILNRHCAWVKKKATKHRCSFESVSEMCPATCGTCEVCADSKSRFRFIYNGTKISRDCRWVVNKNTIERCKIAGIKGSCRKTCSSC